MVSTKISLSGGKGMAVCNEGFGSVLRFEFILKGQCYFEVYWLGSSFTVADVLSSG